MGKTISIYGARVNTDMYKNDIEDLAQRMYDCVYGFGNVIFEYQLTSPDEVRLLWKRKSNYALKGDFISDEDMAMVTNLPLEFFMVQPLGTPVVSPLLPMGKNFYAPTLSFAELYKGMQQAYGNPIKDIVVVANDSDVAITIKFS